VIRLLPYLEGEYKGTYDTSTKKLPRVETSPLERNLGRYYRASQDATMIDFTLSELEGYRNRLTVTGDTDVDLVSVLMPVNNSQGDFHIDFVDNSDVITEGWHYDGASDADYTGIQTLSNKTNGEISSQGIVFRTNGPNLNWKYFSTFDTGFYWICLPGTNGQSFKFWYDEELWTEKLENTDRDVYIDQAGCVWYVERGRNYAIDRKFLSGPDGQAFGKNIKGIYFSTQDNPSDFVNPILDNDTIPKNIINIDSESHFKASSLGNGTTLGDFSGITATNINFSSNLYFSLTNYDSIKNILWNKLGNNSQVYTGERGVGGSWIGSEEYGSGVFGSAIDTTGGQVYFSNVFSGIASEGSIEFFVRPEESSGHGNNYELLKIGDISGTDYLSLTFQDANLEFEIVDGGVTRIGYDEAISYSANDNVHLAVTWKLSDFDDGDNIKLFHNGDEIYGANGTIDVLSALSDNDIYLSNNERTGEGVHTYFNGLFDNVKIWNYGKTDYSDRNEEIATEGSFQFSDQSSGTKEIELKYRDADNNLTEGTKIKFYYDKSEWSNAFSESVNIYIDQLGAVWKGNPEVNGTCISAPYDFVKVSQDDFFILR